MNTSVSSYERLHRTLVAPQQSALPMCACEHRFRNRAHETQVQWLLEVDRVLSRAVVHTHAGGLGPPKNSHSVRDMSRLLAAVHRSASEHSLSTSRNSAVDTKCVHALVIDK